MGCRIGIFGGSFDPVHHGHLVLGRDALEQFGLERLFFVPAAVNPHKLDSEPRVAGALRVEMLRLATAAESRFEVDALEMERTGPSYTADTIEQFRRRWPNAELFFLLGEDNIPKLSSWHRFAEWSHRVTFLSFGRGGSEGGGLLNGVRLERLERRMDVSSTEIRQRIAQGLSIRYLVPETVREFIDFHALYQSHEQ